MEPTLGPGLDMTALSGPAFRPVGPAHAGPIAGPSTAGNITNDWVAEFNNMNIAAAGPAGPVAASAMRVQAHAATMAPANQPVANIAGPTFARGPMFGAPAVGFGGPIMTNSLVAPGAAAAQVAAPVETTAETTADPQAELFEAIFADIEQNLAQSSAAKEQEALDREFAIEQDRWMAQHGPRAEAEMAQINADLEKLAEEQEAADKEKDAADKKRAADEALARAAGDIVNAVADNTSEKFRRSHFFELMRRISNREVVVEGDGFVDAKTGEKVDTDHHLDDLDKKDKDDDAGAAAGMA